MDGTNSFHRQHNPMRSWSPSLKNEISLFTSVFSQFNSPFSKMVLPLPPAAPADIVRARTKDEEYISELERRLKDVLQVVLPNRPGAHNFSWNVTRRLLRLAYYLFTLMGNVPKTAGEEYASVVGVQITNRMVVPSSAASTLLALFLTFSQDDLVKLLARIWRQAVPWLSFPRVAVLGMLDGASRLHLALFYLYGRYYNIANRLLRIRYVETTRDFFSTSTPFHLLGIVIAVQLGFDVGRQLLTIFRNVRRNRIECQEWSSVVARVMKNMLYPGETNNDTQEEGVGRCILCLSGISHPTLTRCGHVFCWKCISSWCATNVSCSKFWLR